jgi:hypothetical protein
MLLTPIALSEGTCAFTSLLSGAGAYRGDVQLESEHASSTAAIAFNSRRLGRRGRGQGQGGLGADMDMTWDG